MATGQQDVFMSDFAKLAQFYMHRFHINWEFVKQQIRIRCRHQTACNSSLSPLLAVSDSWTWAAVHTQSQQMKCPFHLDSHEICKCGNFLQGCVELHTILFVLKSATLKHWKKRNGRLFALLQKSHSLSFFPPLQWLYSPPVSVQNWRFKGEKLKRLVWDRWWTE